MSTATEQWHALVDQYKARGMSNDRAVRTAAVKHPHVHKAYLAEYNDETERRRAAARAAQEDRASRSF